jgi:hypothetical protein
LTPPQGVFLHSDDGFKQIFQVIIPKQVRYLKTMTALKATKLLGLDAPLILQIQFLLGDLGKQIYWF